MQKLEIFRDLTDSQSVSMLPGAKLCSNTLTYFILNTYQKNFSSAAPVRFLQLIDETLDLVRKFLNLLPVSAVSLITVKM